MQVFRYLPNTARNLARAGFLKNGMIPDLSEPEPISGTAVYKMLCIAGHDSPSHHLHMLMSIFVCVVVRTAAVPSSTVNKPAVSHDQNWVNFD